MAESGGLEPRSSFVVHADGSHGPLVVQDLVSLRRVQLETLDLLPGQIEQWLEAGADAAAPRAPAMPLTRSEARVARLAIEGLTNRQIGVVLGVRLRTVESHLTAAYRKLGIRSRRELAHRLAPPS
jgi:DNA-binding CsgD family transcriptional regulator